MADVPDLPWYRRISTERNVSTRCPFATVEACPRYYQSLSLLGEAGSTKIESQEDARLLAKWKATDLWPRTAEQATSLFGPSGNPHHFANFCPEVTFDRFGHFATYLARYSDEIDIGVAHEQLGRDHVPAGDPRWSWASTTPQHYTECPLYSVLARRSNAAGADAAPAPPPWWREHLAKIVVGILVAVLSALAVKLLA